MDTEERTKLAMRTLWRLNEEAAALGLPPPTMAEFKREMARVTKAKRRYGKRKRAYGSK